MKNNGEAEKEDKGYKETVSLQSDGKNRLRENLPSSSSDTSKQQRLYPIYLIQDILNSERNAAISDNATVMRNFLMIKLKEHFNTVEIWEDNVLLLANPITNITPFRAIFIRILKKAEAHQIRKYNEYVLDLIKMIPALKEEDVRKTFFQQYNIILITKVMTPGTKMLCYRLHNDYITITNKDWQGFYTGKHIEKDEKGNTT